MKESIDMHLKKVTNYLFIKLLFGSKNITSSQFANTHRVFLWLVWLLVYKTSLPSPDQFCCCS